MSRRAINIIVVATLLASLAILLTPMGSFALPAYSTATGQPCTACHTTATGGPLTAQGQAFAAISTHATNPAAAWAQVSQPAPTATKAATAAATTAPAATAAATTAATAAATKAATTTAATAAATTAPSTLPKTGEPFSMAALAALGLLLGASGFALRRR